MSRVVGSPVRRYGLLRARRALRLRDNEEALFEALRLDLGKPGFESYAGEVGWCQNDIIYVCDRLEKWAGDEKPADVPLLNAPLSPRIRKDPLGVVLVIGSVAPRTGRQPRRERRRLTFFAA